MLVGLTINPAFAAQPNAYNTKSISIVNVQAIPSKLNQGLRYEPLAEPVFKKVQYLTPEPPGYVEQQIESLVNGININVAPEHDHYGYEIRRYMASIAGPKILVSKEEIKQQLTNIKKAEIVLDYWRKNNSEKVKTIRAEMEKDNAKASLRSSFNYHNGTANAFFTEAQSWIDNNRDFLIFIYKLDNKSFNYIDPNIMFRDREDAVKFISILESQKAARKQIHKYVPFRTMVY